MKTKSKLNLLLLLTVLAIILLSSCGSRNAHLLDESKPTIVCSGFAQYDWVLNILGDEQDNWNVLRLNEKGADMHSYQPTAKDMAVVAKSDLLVCTGGFSEEWLRDVSENNESYEGSSYFLLDHGNPREENFTGGISIKGHTHEDGHPHGEEGDVHELDEHIWLSPKNAIIFCGEIATEISAIDPANADTYGQNTAEYIKRLEALDSEYTETIENCPGNTFIVADRFPFGYLAEDYGLSYYAAFPGCSAETEASFDTIIFLAERAGELNAPALLITEHSSDSVARTVIKTSGKTDTAIYELNSMQSVRADDLKCGITYISAMEANLSVLRKVLN